MFYKIIHRILQRGKIGSLVIENYDNRANKVINVDYYGSVSSEKSPVKIRVLDQRFYQKILFKGDVGFGEAYFLDYWETEDLRRVLTWFLNNSKYLLSFAKSKKRNILFWPMLKLYQFNHYLRRNTIKNSRKNINKHYDLSNEFYQIWLSKEMAYSSGYFKKSNETLEKVQENKFQKIIEKLELNANDHLLEIGCGWGGFAIYAAQNIGCQITAITISQAQYDYFQKKIKEYHLGKKIDLKFIDYRSMTGEFDKIVSIEMMEAIGLQYYDHFFAQCSRLLKKNGIIVLQCITFPDCYFDKYLNNHDYIQEFIFPGSMLLSLQRILQAMQRTGILYLYDLETIGAEYAKTLFLWRERMMKNMNSIMELGFNKQFIKKWIYYLSYCEVGFSQNYINDVQLVLSNVQNQSIGRYKSLQENQEK